MSGVARGILCFALLLSSGCGGKADRGTALPYPKTKLRAGFQCGIVPDEMARELLGRRVDNLFDYDDGGWLAPNPDPFTGKTCRSEEKGSPVSYLDITFFGHMNDLLPKVGEPSHLHHWKSRPGALRMPASWGEGYVDLNSDFSILRKCTKKTSFAVRMIAHEPRPEVVRWDPVFREVVSAAEELYGCTEPRLPKDATLVDARPLPEASPSPVSS